MILDLVKLVYYHLQPFAGSSDHFKMRCPVRIFLRDFRILGAGSRNGGVQKLPSSGALDLKFSEMVEIYLNFIPTKFQSDLEILRPVARRCPVVARFFWHIMLTPGVSWSRHTFKLSHKLVQVGCPLLPSIAHVCGCINIVAVALPGFGGSQFQLGNCTPQNRATPRKPC